MDIFTRPASGEEIKRNTRLKEIAATLEGYITRKILSNATRKLIQK